MEMMIERIFKSFLITQTMKPFFCYGSRILFLFPTPSKSHMVIVHALSTTLSERGHEVTVVSPFPLENKIANHRDIKSPIPRETMEHMNRMFNNSVGIFKSMILTNKILCDMGLQTVKTEAFRNLLNEKFDLIIIGMTFQNFLLGFGDHFKCPTAMLSVQKHWVMTSELVGNPFEVHSVPHMTLKLESNLLWRLKNFLLVGAEALMLMVMNFHQKTVYDELFPSSDFRSYEDSIKNISLTLINDHFASGFPRPLVPASIEIREIQVNPEPKILPENIKSFLDDAENGVIFFSLGSNVKSTILTKEKKETILQTLARLNQKVIIKWDDEIENKPKNILAKKWLPQDDILAHPNIKLFISHCGLGSLVESKYHGVPVLAIPVFGDQFTNAKEAVKDGRAIELNFEELNEVSFYDTINEMVQNQTYFIKAKQLSLLDRDRPISARDNAVYWIEYVMRHHGAPHLQYPGIHLNFWQRNSLDVIALLVVLIYAIYKISKVLIKFIFKLLKKNFRNKKIKKN